MDRLATAAGTSARTCHDFYKVIFCLAFFDPLDQTSGIAKTTDYGSSYFCACDLYLGFPDSILSADNFKCIRCRIFSC